MSKKRIAVFIVLLLVAVASNYLVLMRIRPDGELKPRLVMDVNSDKEQLYQIYYSYTEHGDGAWAEEDSVTADYNAKGKTRTIELAFPQEVKYIRFDLGGVKGEHKLSDIEIECKHDSIELDLQDIMFEDQKHMISSMEESDGTYTIVTNGADPYLVLDVSEYNFHDFVMNAQETPVRMNRIILCVAIDLLLLGAFLFLHKFAQLPLEVYRNRQLVMSLAKNDFKTKYAGSYLGIIWAFVQPIVTIAVYAFVFQVGFRAVPVNDVPYVLVLTSGMVPWFFFSDALNGGTSSMIEYSYLVKKVVFKISILPIVKIISALFVHMFFVVITIILFAIFGFYPDIYTLQVVYYSFCMFIFVLGITYATCSIIIFFRDLGQIIGIFLQVGVWLTPIMWQETMVSESSLWILKINPIYYVVSGYRDALINKVWFWQNPNWLVYFWAVTAVLFVIGSVVFKRLKVHFADVL